MRLFVGLWPPPPVVDLLEALPRPDHPAVRWTTRDQWHVTLHFIGAAEPADLPPLVRSLEDRLVGHPAPDLTLGPEVGWLGRLRRSPLVVPVQGADDLATAVIDLLGELPAAVGSPFRGHLTLARVRRGKTAPSGLSGRPVAASWTADQLAVVRSHLDQEGARYETVAEVPLRTGPTPAR